MTVLDEGDEEETVETAPDHISTSASETSSKASYNSQPQLLDFIGASCNVSAWFTSCFPCAVVDINDSDDYVMDKLSRESAMNVMYARNNISNSPPVSPDRSKGSDEQDTNLMYVRLPEQMTQNDAPVRAIPSLVVEENNQDDEAMDTISLDDDSGPDSMPVATESFDSGILDDSPFLEASVNENSIYPPPKSPPKKKKKFGMKIFGRKKGV